MNARSTLAMLTAMAAASTLAGCDLIDILQGKPAQAERQHTANLAARAAADAATPDIEGMLAAVPPVVAEVAPVAVVSEPPAPVYEYDRYNADPAGYVCTAVFRSLSCLDDGRPVYLDAQMGQLPFGERP